MASRSSHRFDLLAPTQKSGLRLSASLQEISTLGKLDPEEGNLDHQFNGLSHAKPIRPLQREALGASFSKDKTPASASFSRKKCVRVVVGLLCLILFIFLIYAVWRQFTDKNSHYYIVLDCGSTGTRAYVYESTVNQRGHESLPITLRSLPEDFQKKSAARTGRAYQRMETEPGFDKLVRNVSGLKAAIKPLLRWAEKQIPKKAHKDTSLFLYATAGVRRLPTSDSDWLLDKAWSILKNSSFLCHRKWVKIISGMEEAYYGWIALNYNMGMLGSYPKKPTFGALDLGGSSLQVTFETDGLVSADTSLSLNIGSSDHHLTAYSLEGYGLNDAFDKSVVYLLKKQFLTKELDLNKEKIVIKHPCLQQGYKEEYMCSQCASLNQEGSPVVGGRSTGKTRFGKSVELLGAPHWEECSALAKITVNLSEWSQATSGIDCEIHPCALTSNSPQPQGQFYAMSGFYVVFRFFNLTSEATLDDVLQKGQEFCQSNWDTAKKSVVPQPFVEQYCFRAPYIASLLREGLHISDNQVTVGSGSITWTLGVALLEAGQTFSSKLELGSYKIFSLKLGPSVLIGLLVFSLILLICALSCISNWGPRLSRLPYLPLFSQSSTTSSVLNIPSPFRLQRWSPISTGEGRAKMPLSPTVAGSQKRPFGMGYGLGGSSIQLTDSLHLLGGGVSHSYSSGSLGQLHIDNGTGSSWAPHRGQMRLQSRRSQSREDLNSSLSESHLVNV
ncbi:probable apyrase 7 isoform X2 [Aristolochia californica]|uniref:probable apyrase 7 isoform X2 n=1 Tax=Aristolochia californica TaxID=171875 RepID=UPI0035E22060